MFLFLAIILILIIYFIYLIIKYSGMEKPEFDLQYFRDKNVIKYPMIIVGYLNKMSIKDEHFIATALDFVCKGFITLEPLPDKSDYIFTIIKNISASPLEIDALKIFFNSRSLDIGSQQSLNQFKKIMRIEKLFGNYGKIKRSFNRKIREYFDSRQEVKQITDKTNKKNIIICYILFLIIHFSSQTIFVFGNVTNNIILIFFVSSITFALFTKTLTFIKSSLLGNSSWVSAIIAIAFFINMLSLIYFPLAFFILLILVIMGIIILFDDMIQRKKTNIANAYEMLQGLKKYIIHYSNIDKYDLDTIYLWDEYYVYAVAINIKKI